MKRHILFCIFLSVASCSYAKDGLKSLFNGKDLKGFAMYVGAEEKGGKAIGLNTDPLKIFTVVPHGGEMVLRILER